MIGRQTAQMTAPHGIVLDDTAQSRLDDYFDLLTRANEQFNLTRIRGERETAEKHFYDSLSPLWLTALPAGASLIDIGAGAGFPGMVLKIVRPDLSVTAVDSVGKKVRFLQETADALGLDGFAAVHGRCEDLGKNPQYREQFDLCTARAVAPLVTLLELALPLVKVGGRLLAYKGPTAPEELEQARKALDALGGRAETLPYILPGGDGRVLTVVHKIRPCPAAFPRKAPLPSQKPIGG